MKFDWIMLHKWNSAAFRQYTNSNLAGHALTKSNTLTKGNTLARDNTLAKDNALTIQIEKTFVSSSRSCNIKLWRLINSLCNNPYLSSFRFASCEIFIFAHTDYLNKVDKCFSLGKIKNQKLKTNTLPSKTPHMYWKNDHTLAVEIKKRKRGDQPGLGGTMV